MKSYKFADRDIHCGDASQWEALLGLCERDTPGTVLDLRTFLEVGDQPVPKPPEGWGYRRLPLTGATVSEQDLDVFRREFYRKSQTVVIGPNGSRSRLMVAASVARLEKGGWNGRQRAEEDVEGEHGLLEWLTSYLVRHGFEQAEALEAVRAKTPARKARPDKPAKPTKSKPAAEPTVEMPAVEPEEGAASEATVELAPGDFAPAESSSESSSESLVEPSVEASVEAVQGKGSKSSSKSKPAKAKGSSKRKK